MILQARKLNALTYCVIIQLSGCAEIHVCCTHKGTKTKYWKKKKNNSYFLQVLDPYQDQDEESAVVVMEESDKKFKSAQDTVIDGPLPVPNTFQTFAT